MLKYVPPLNLGFQWEKMKILYITPLQPTERINIFDPKAYVVCEIEYIRGYI